MEPPGAVFESLDLAERLTDKSSRRRQEGLALSAGDAPWTLLAATPCRLTSISVTWASRVEKAAEHAKEVGVFALQRLVLFCFVSFFSVDVFCRHQVVVSP